ncbi:hypothetical protein [Actinophytocola sp.]|uniref:hypothetical protein n=1 Tax=Actinophytocola sp. TaxID=1872138 RepID=UPI00389A2C0E
MVMLMASACTDRGDGESLVLPGLTSATSQVSGKDGSRSTMLTAEPSSPGSDEDPGSSDGADSDTGGDTGDGEGSGPGGAPWDPCRIITWDDLPGERPTDDTQATPEPQAADPEAAYTAACRFRAKTNDVAVLWGPSSKATVAPSGQHGEEQTTIAGRPGLKIVDLSEGLTLICMAKVDLGNGRGVAGVGAFARSKEQTTPDKHPCAVALRLAAEIVKRTV